MEDTYTHLKYLAKTYSDVQNTRIRVTNRTRAGYPDLPLAERLKEDEAYVSKEMVKLLKTANPIAYQWASDTPGIGLHLLARLLGETGDPLIATPSFWEDNPDYDPSKPAGDKNRKRLLYEQESYERSVSQLWAYCGLGDPTKKRRKGMHQEEAFECGNPQAKMVMHLIAEACLKAKRTSPYGQCYDAYKEKYLAKGMTKGHAHNAALRKIKKDVLRDLWVVCRVNQPVAV